MLGFSLAADTHTVPAFESMKVLVVDDDPDVRNELSAGLQDLGVNVVIADGADKALDILRRDHEITVMVADYYMPSTNGLDLVTEINGIRPEFAAVESIMLTGGANLDLAINAIRSHVFDFARKPIRLAPLVTSLQKAHAAAMARRERVNDRLLTLIRLGISTDEARHAFLTLIHQALAKPSARPNGDTAAAANDDADHLSVGRIYEYSEIVRVAGDRLAGALEAVTTIAALSGGIEKPLYTRRLPLATARHLVERYNPDAVLDPALEEAAQHHRMMLSTDQHLLLMALEQMLIDAIQRQPRDAGPAVVGYQLGPVSVEFTVTAPDDVIDVARLGDYQALLQSPDLMALLRQDRIGLNLILAARLAAAINASISLRSAPDAGTTTSLTIPL
jgi:FixJ family two-component response regulator